MYHCYLHLKWVTNEKNMLLFLEQFLGNFVLKPLGFRKLNHASEMRNALMHHEGLKGLLLTLTPLTW